MPEQFRCQATPAEPAACADPSELGSTYVYLLGLYLGDGCISRAPRNVWRLRIFQDERYPRLADACARAVEHVCGRTPGRMRRDGCIEIYSNWKHWVCLIPQHGAGRKHARSMQLFHWQRQLVVLHPRALLRGLLESDGSRFVNRVRRPGRQGIRTYEYVRYLFTNASSDIRELFAEACRLVGIDCRPTTERDISVARHDSVVMLDTFVGPKR